MGATKGLVVSVGVACAVAACHCVRQAAAKVATRALAAVAGKGAAAQKRGVQGGHDDGQ